MSVRAKKYLCTFVVAFACALWLSPAFASESAGEASMDDIIAGVKSLCGGKGSGVEVQVTGGAAIEASKAVSLLINGKIAGSASFSKEEWDGIRAVRDDAKSYTQCVQTLTPLFIDKFSIKKQSFNVIIKGTRGWLRFRPRSNDDYCTITLTIDGKTIFKDKNESRFNDIKIKLEEGDHEYNFDVDTVITPRRMTLEEEYNNFRNYNPNREGKDSDTPNCKGVFKVDQATILEPHINISKDGDITKCSLDTAN